MALWRHFLAKISQSPEEEERMPAMSFGDHLDDLRKRLILSLLGAAIGIVICTLFANNIIDFLFQPYLLALRYSGYPQSLLYNKPAGNVIMYLMLGIKAGLLLASPWIIYQFWLFVAAGLYRRERSLVYRYIGPSIFLFIVGVAFFFLLVLPIMLKFFLAFNQQVPMPHLQPNAIENMIYGKQLEVNSWAKLPTGNQVKPLLIPMVRSNPTHFPKHHIALWYNAVQGRLLIHAEGRVLALNAQPADSLFAPLAMLHDYLGFVTIMALVFGLAFELPMVMMVLAQIGVMSARKFGRMWRYAVLILAVLSALLAPTPDIVTFSSIFVPLVLLYALGLILATFVTSRKKDDSAADTSAPEDQTVE
ncbi:MAG: twin-arginine translocase subunit TatC [Phycisphaerae bacterium]